LRDGVGDRFEERLERGSGGGRAHPGGRTLAGVATEERGG